MTGAPGTSPIFRVDPASDRPKYRQIVENVCRALRNGALRKGDPLPSLNALSASHGLARDTVVKAYNALKALGVLAPAHGKGFYVATDHYVSRLRLFVLFDAMTPYKEILYEGLRAELAGRAQLDIYFHYFNPELFAKLLDDARGRYEYYVVMPFPEARVRRILRSFDQDRLLLLDIAVDYPGKRCACVSQSHDTELERALGEAASRIRRYRSLTLVFPEDRHHPVVIKPAFRRFCRREGLRHAVTERLEAHTIRKGHAYFVIEDADLVRLIQTCRRQGLRLGRDVGVISYNDTPMKEVVQDGISVISVDFAALGRHAARQALARATDVQLWEPTRFISRDSL
jgi:DNA-binding transcriptional regulator YhcF (GntR family)